MPVLFTIENENGTKEYPCPTMLSIGRDENSDIIINDRQVSRNHAMIRRLGKSDYYLIDSGSINGSFVNDKRMSTPTLLKNGDQITIGPATINFIHHEQQIEKTKIDDTESTLLMQNVNIRLITILVADIRGFTTLSEEISISTLSKIMSEWFRRVSDLVAEKEGTVDKFIGDCVYARWEARDDVSITVINALKAAGLIKKLTEELNQVYLGPPYELKIGVGINTGRAAVGVGQDNTAIGDAVNLAFRLESASKELKKDVVLSQGAYQYLPESLWRQAESEIMVKGKKEAVKVCGLSFAEIKLFFQDESFTG
ncbi:MAG: FHA domain-containing protein [Gammaproteobacteria bacterium]|nr:FHA domain-containing protein [Gammaproteobacteria bacterium]